MTFTSSRLTSTARVAALVLALAIPSAPVRGQEPLTTQLAMTLNSILHGWQSSLFTLGLFVPGTPVGQQFLWSMTYTETSATFTGSGIFAGQQLSLNGTGTLAGNYGSDLTWADTFTGAYGPDPVAITDQSQFFWNAVDAVYDSASSAQAGLVGTDLYEWASGGSHQLSRTSNMQSGTGWKNAPAGGGMEEVKDSYWVNVWKRLVHKVRVGLELDREDCGGYATGAVKGSFFVASLGCGGDTSGDLENGSGGGETTVTPEPGTLLLVGIGLAALALSVRRRERHV